MITRILTFIETAGDVEDPQTLQASSNVNVSPRPSGRSLDEGPRNSLMLLTVLSGLPAES